LVGELILVDVSGLPGEGHANRGKHRTEVTEATEGDWVGGELILVDVSGLPGEGHANWGKHRTEGIGIWWANAFGG
jgi:hypothetical protein